MEIIYLCHSGFAILCEEATLVFDFFRDTREEDRGILHDELLKRPGRFYVFSSHFHEDHFHPSVLTWKAVRPDIVYIFSKDILRRRRVHKDVAHWLKKGDVFRDDYLLVKAFGSTDAGISFYIEVEGKRIFHAGDLNNWHWMDECAPEVWQKYEKNFLAELSQIKKSVSELDVAMFPVDPRLGKEYMRGAKQWVENIVPDVFVPMHFAPEYDKANAFRTIAEAHGCRFFSITEGGATFEV